MKTGAIEDIVKTGKPIRGLCDRQGQPGPARAGYARLLARGSRVGSVHRFWMDLCLDSKSVKQSC